MTTKASVYAGLLLLVLAPSTAFAQFIGFTSPQTATQQLGTSQQNCTGIAQDFPVQNLGQTEHYLVVVSDGHATHLRVNMFGVNQNGARVQIGDQLEMANLTGGAVFAAGYFPQVVVEVQCTPVTARYTLTYSGVWATPPPTIGNFLQTQIDKEIFNGMSGTAPIVYSIAPPFGTSAGEIIFRFVSGPAAGTIDARCESAPGVGITWAVNVLAPGTAVAANTTQQGFQIPNFPCPELTIDYFPGGGAIYLAYLFQPAGFTNWPMQAPTASAINQSPTAGNWPLNGTEDGVLGAAAVGAIWAGRRWLKKPATE